MESHQMTLALTLAIIATLSVQAQGGWQEDFNACAAQVSPPISNEDRENMQRGKTPDTRPGKCVLACMFKKVGLMDPSGKFSASNMKTMAPIVHQNNADSISRANKVADACAAEVPTNLDECETSVKIGDCLMRKGQEFGLPPAGR